MAPLTRFAAPAAFLIVVTVGVLVLRGAIRDEPAASSAAARTAPPRPAPRAAARHATRPAPQVVARFHEIRSGDTLGAVADRYETSVTEIVELNPGIDPTALQVGQRVRVK
jgi:Tfp pilus assembly protein FimV